MFLKAALLIILGILCLILTVVALIFSVIGFANNKQNKYVWLTTFLCGLIGLAVCIFMFVRKAVNTVQNMTENAFGQFQKYGDSLANIESIDTHQANNISAQITLLKSYLPENSSGNEPEQFYTYLGFKDYYRYPLRYPYSIHCMGSQDNGELFNENNVSRFDENDNGEIYAGLNTISKIAFDKTYLLVEQVTTSTRTDKMINHYVLYNLDTQHKEETTSLTKLIVLAKEKGYKGPDTLMTMEEYGRLFQ
jgi:hypothetical protein